ncbi:hypothetical protein MESS2_530002 [Mesorhizobium metallidurans STM 2683]|uniref:Uncharacterized protein n=1 Tax=Mesorhizobium metallidurans STM 2683 TaxID=1297569 RepID=M5ETT8_9HYPH|nr:hypothetical protein [Mesorhizobium metallidurans]CCV07328.1 hypothetical protein MESS2_530002 [Mesorhizobium metallidurans STM 2683]
MSLTYKAVQEVLRKAGIVMSKKGEVHRINFFSGLEDTAYYATDLQDVLDRGLAMSKGRPRSSDYARSAEERRMATRAHLAALPLMRLVVNREGGIADRSRG